MTACISHHKVSLTNPSLSTGWDSLYRYTADLLCLEFHRPRTPHTFEVLAEVSTPLNVKALSRALAKHPDRAFARYICNGLHSGFRVGFWHGSPLQSPSANMLSTRQHPEVIRDYLQSELTKGRMLGPFSSAECLPTCTQTFGSYPMDTTWENEAYHGPIVSLGPQHQQRSGRSALLSIVYIS